MEIIFRAATYNGSVSCKIKCCGEYMVVREGKAKHFNDNPHTYRCKKCKKWFKANFHHFTCPRPAHSQFNLIEVNRIKGDDDNSNTN